MVYDLWIHKSSLPLPPVVGTAQPHPGRTRVWQLGGQLLSLASSAPPTPPSKVISFSPHPTYPSQPEVDTTGLGRFSFFFFFLGFWIVYFSQKKKIEVLY